MVTANRGKILIIEDTAGFRRVYQDALEAEGYDVVDADDGIWGLQLAIEEKPDVILLDLILPGMHGYDVLTELRANPNTKSIPVIVLSSLGEGKDIRQEQGNIQKPLGAAPEDLYYRPSGRKGQGGF